MQLAPATAPSPPQPAAAAARHALKERGGLNSAALLYPALRCFVLYRAVLQDSAVDPRCTALRTFRCVHVEAWGSPGYTALRYAMPCCSVQRSATALPPPKHPPRHPPLKARSLSSTSCFLMASSEAKRSWTLASAWGGWFGWFGWLVDSVG